MSLEFAHERCRICLEKTQSLVSLHKKVPIDEDNILMLEILRYCGKIEVLHNDRKPQNVCSACIEKAKEAYRFKLMCMQSETTLNTEILNKMINLRDPLAFKKEDDFIDIKDEEISNIKDEEPNAKVGSEEEEQSDNSFNDYDNAEREENSDCFENIDEQEESNNSIENNDDNVENTGKTEKYKHKCPHCDENFRFRSYLLRHIRSHHRTEKKCGYCDYKAVGHQVGMHMHKMHYDLKTIQCPNCIKRFFHLRDLKRHMDKNHRQTNTEEKSHKIIHGQSFVCNLCGKEYMRMGELRRHEMVHSEERPYPCSLCDKRFRTNRTLKDHMNIHTRELTFKCDVCSKVCSKKHDLQLHLRKHTGERPYVCKVCGKTYTHPKSLRTHKASQHPDT